MHPENVHLLWVYNIWELRYHPRINWSCSLFNCQSLRNSYSGFCLRASSVQFSTVAQLCPTLCDPMNCSTSGLPVHHQLSESYCSWGEPHEYWSGLPFPSPVDHILSDLSTMTRPSWVDPHAWLRFIKLQKAVVRAIRLTSFLWVWFQCVCPLMPSRNTYCLTGFLLPWMWGISSQLLKQSTAAAPYLGPGVSPHPLPSWPWMWSSSSRPSCAHAAATPWTWGCSSRPPPLTSDTG